jgi:hypothetical protein
MDVAGFSRDAIGEFYNALRTAVRTGQIRETRPAERTILLEVVPG